MLEKLQARRKELTEKRDQILAQMKKGEAALHRIAGALATLDEVEKEIPRDPGFKAEVS